MRRRATGAGLYDAMGIAYDDKQARWDAMKLNWGFLAPVGLFSQLINLWVKTSGVILA